VVREARGEGPRRGAEKREGVPRPPLLQWKQAVSVWDWMRSGASLVKGLIEGAGAQAVLGYGEGGELPWRQG